MMAKFTGLFWYGLGLHKHHTCTINVDHNYYYYITTDFGYGGEKGRVF